MFEEIAFNVLCIPGLLIDTKHNLTLFGRGGCCAIEYNGSGRVETIVPLYKGSVRSKRGSYIHNNVGLVV